MATRREVLAYLAASPLLSRGSFALSRSLGSMPEPVGDLAKAFLAPPDSTRPYVLWMWMGSNITREGITLDLEGMKEAGIGGATIYSLADTLTPWAGVILKSPTPEIVTYNEPWWALVRHAASECRRLGLELLLHNCAGYESSGGPWITPELSMQEVVWSEQRITGSKHIATRLPRAVIDPHPHAQFPIVYIPSLGRDGIPVVKARQDYHRDIAVIALPAAGVPTMDQVLDLSSHMTPDGKLSWDAPAGDWSIYRFGHTTTGAMIQPAQWDAMGLECDKMSVEAVTFHCRHVLEDIKRHVGDLIGNPGLSKFYSIAIKPANQPGPRRCARNSRPVAAMTSFDIFLFSRAQPCRQSRNQAISAGFQANRDGPFPRLLLGNTACAGSRVRPGILRRAL